MDTQTNPPEWHATTTPWYRSRAGKVFLWVLGILVLFALFFFGTVGYYAYQIKSGKGANLAQQFISKEFTADPSLGAIPSVPGESFASLIRPENPTLGEAGAPVTIVAFIDFECPFCQKAYPGFQNMLDRYGPAVRVVFKHFPLTSIHPNAESSAIAAACAAEQNMFWNFYDLLFQQKRLDAEALSSYATELNMDHLAFQECQKNPNTKAIVDADFADGIAIGVRGTPTYVVNGVLLQGVVPEQIWDRVIIEGIGKRE